MEFTKDVTYEESVELTNSNFLRHLLNAISSNEFDASVRTFQRGLQIVQLILVVLTNCCLTPLLWMQVFDSELFQWVMRQLDSGYATSVQKYAVLTCSTLIFQAEEQSFQLNKLAT